MKIIALVIFIAVYALLLLLPKYRALVAMTAAVIFMAGDCSSNRGWQHCGLERVNDVGRYHGHSGLVYPLQDAQSPV